MSGCAGRRASLVASDTQGRRPLHDACDGGHCDVAAWLLDQPGVDASDPTLLELACDGEGSSDEGRAALGALLLQHDARPTCEAFRIACARGRLALAQRLYEALGAAAWTDADERGLQALHRVCGEVLTDDEARRVAVAAWLLDNDAPMDASDGRGWRPLHHALVTCGRRSWASCSCNAAPTARAWCARTSVQMLSNLSDAPDLFESFLQWLTTRHSDHADAARRPRPDSVVTAWRRGCCSPLRSGRASTFPSCCFFGKTLARQSPDLLRQPALVDAVRPPARLSPRNAGRRRAGAPRPIRPLCAAPPDAAPSPPQDALPAGTAAGARHCREWRHHPTGSADAPGDDPMHVDDAAAASSADAPAAASSNDDDPLAGSAEAPMDVEEPPAAPPPTSPPAAPPGNAVHRQTPVCRPALRLNPPARAPLCADLRPDRVVEWAWRQPKRTAARRQRPEQPRAHRRPQPRSLRQTRRAPSERRHWTRRQQSRAIRRLAGSWHRCPTAVDAGTTSGASSVPGAARSGDRAADASVPRASRSSRASAGRACGRSTRCPQERRTACASPGAWWCPTRHRPRAHAGAVARRWILRVRGGLLSAREPGPPTEHVIVDGRLCAFTNGKEAKVTSSRDSLQERRRPEDGIGAPPKCPSHLHCALTVPHSPRPQSTTWRSRMRAPSCT